MDYLSELGLLQLLLIWGVILLAAVLRAFTGFGFALAAMPIYALLLPPAEAVVLSASLALGIGVVTAPSYVKDAPTGSLLPMLLGSLLGTVAGTALLLRLQAEHFLLGIGLAVIAACAALSIYRPRRTRRSAAAAGMVGLLSGVLNGTFAIPGPPAIVYALASEAEPRAARALLLAFFTFSAVLALAAYSAAGIVGWHSLWLFAFAFPVMLAGDRLGLRLFRRYGDALYKRVAVGALFLIGISATAKALL